MEDLLSVYDHFIIIIIIITTVKCYAEDFVNVDLFIDLFSYDR